MKKVLMISYYFPPAGGPGVQRVLKFVRYLPEHGWEPIVLTVRNGSYPNIDSTLLKEVPTNLMVVKTKTFEPFTLYKLLTGKERSEGIPIGFIDVDQAAPIEKLSNLIRANLFVPDARVGWYPFAVSAGRQLLQRERPNLVFTSGTPHSVHLIGKRLKKLSGRRWLADFRDPWTTIYYNQYLLRFGFVDDIDRSLERSVLASADIVTTVSRSLADELSQRAPADSGKYEILPNGFDEDDFKGVPVEQTSKFRITYVGNLLPNQNPPVFWKVLRQFLDEDSQLASQFELFLIGNIDQSALKSLEEYGLSRWVTHRTYVAHRLAIEYMRQSPILLLLVPNIANNRGILTGKLFEYIGARRSILALGPPGCDADDILQETATGTMIQFDDRNAMRSTLSSLVRHWRSGELKRPQGNPTRLNYTRRKLTEKLARLFDSLVES